MSAYYELKCPRCGDTYAYIFVNDNGCWVARCDECGLSEVFNPETMVPKMFPDWVVETKHD